MYEYSLWHSSLTSSLHHEPNAVQSRVRRLIGRRRAGLDRYLGTLSREASQPQDSVDPITELLSQLSGQKMREKRGHQCMYAWRIKIIRIFLLNHTFVLIVGWKLQFSSFCFYASQLLLKSCVMNVAIPISCITFLFPPLHLPSSFSPPPPLLSSSFSSSSFPPPSPPFLSSTSPPPLFLIHLHPMQVQVVVLEVVLVEWEEEGLEGEAGALFQMFLLTFSSCWNNKIVRHLNEALLHGGQSTGKLLAYLPQKVFPLHISCQVCQQSSYPTLNHG